MKNKKYLVALPTVKGQRNFDCPTKLVIAKNKEEAISIVKHLVPTANIGLIKEVNY